MSSLDELWDFANPALSECRFRDALVADRFERAEILSQIARAVGLQHRFDEALEILAEARSSHPSPRASVRIVLETGRVHNSSGHPKTAKPVFEEALRLALEASEDALAVDAAHMIAIAAEGDDALAWNLKAIQMAEGSSAPSARKWLASLHNNTGWTYHDRNDFDLALVHFEKALAERRRQGDPTTTRIAEWCVARCLRSLGRFDEALSIQLRLLAEADGDGYGHEETAECLLALNRPAEAQPYFATAYRLLSTDAWLAESEPSRLTRLASLGGVDV